MLTARIASLQITAGAQAAMTARLAEDGSGIAGVTLRLLELGAGTQGWQIAGTAVTDSTGRADLVVPSLTTNATLQVKGPGGAASEQFDVVVIPAVQVSVSTPGKSPNSMATVTCQYCQAGDAVQLQVLSTGQWQVQHSKRLDQSGQVTFTLKAQKTSVSYQIVLVSTALHGSSVSSVITVAGHTGSGKHS